VGVVFAGPKPEVAVCIAVGKLSEDHREVLL